jgi:hypothetical protein
MKIIQYINFTVYIIIVFHYLFTLLVRASVQYKGFHCFIVCG